MVSAGEPRSGVVTFLFTDIEGSTRRWESDADGMRVALAAHDKALRSAIEAYEGFLFSHTGDGVAAAFASPNSAIDAAVAAQRELELPVRITVIAATSRPLRKSCSRTERRNGYDGNRWAIRTPTSRWLCTDQPARGEYHTIRLTVEHQGEKGRHQ